jgi:hypothetical protein
VCKKSFENKEDLLTHLHEGNHISEMPDEKFYDQPEYFFSTFEDDNLLCVLDDSTYLKDELKYQVIPEQYDIKIDEELISNFKEIL